MPGVARAARLADGRLHLQHGPIDLLIEAFGSDHEVEAAYHQARLGFAELLATLVEELSVLRQPVTKTYPELHGPVARRMVAAGWPHRAEFITPMAAVAGAVADQILDHMLNGRQLERAYVNNGGDIALHLASGQRFRTGLVSQLENPAVDGVCTIDADMPVRGLATSGRGGRSFSLGIADAVTVLAASAAAADAAATLLANAVDSDHPGVRRVPACELDEDSDLGTRPVTIAVGDLDDGTIERALAAGAARAWEMLGRGLIYGAVLTLKRRFQVIGGGFSGIALK